jgi:hypothetical protein
MRTEGNVLMVTHKKLRIVAKDNIDVSTSKSFTLVAKKTGRVDGGDLLELQGKVVKIGQAKFGVAHVGSLVECSIVLTSPLVGLPAAPGSPVVIPAIHPVTGQLQVLRGTVTAGNDKIRV